MAGTLNTLTTEEKGPVREISRRIEESGPIPFSEFMEVALYWHSGGYYTSETATWGAEGDYITSIDVSTAFSTAIARQVLEMWEVMGAPAEFDLVEAGAGRGFLSKGVLSALKEISHPLYESTRLRVVEKNPHLRKRQEQKVFYYEDLSGLAHIKNGVILSNELIDSFPVHRVVMRDGVLSEIYVGLEGGGFTEVEGPLSTDKLSAYFEEVAIGFSEGQRAEVNLIAGEWISEAAAVLDRGFVVTIDYGLPARELFSPERRGGTLLCHYRHTLNDNPFVNIGAQDITSHVDFTSFVKSGEKRGLALTGFTTQKNFLLGLSIHEGFRTPGGEGGDYCEDINYNRSIARLIAPGGMGDTFKVLVQHKGLKRPSLKGFSFKEMSRCL
ncbi:MAG: SAM-dependent methyltransferase [Thermodesulfobacteriota bacterium]|nr:MAG: SAM-dependent methyltransferase [Thermodesulfobacteriota bacterium]